MLNDSERRSLAGIEARLSADDPSWVEGFDTSQRRLPVGLRPAGQRAVLVGAASVGAVLALLALLAGITSLSTLFILGTAWSVWMVGRPVRPANPEDRPGSFEGS